MAKNEYLFNEPGIGHVGSYQASGHPYLTGSRMDVGHQLKIEFPSVTKSITVMNTGSAEIRIHFASTGSTVDGARVIDYNHYWPLDSKEDAMTMNVKCKDIYISNGGSTLGGFKLFAELTRIPRGRMFLLSGSGINE